MPYREEILQQALALPPIDRAFVAAALEESLTPAAELPESAASAVSGEALLAELNRRSAAYRNGAQTARPAAEVIANLRRLQAAE